MPTLRPSLPQPASGPVTERIAARVQTLGGGLAIRRALPTAARRMVGPWVFLDHFGPLPVRAGEGMDVAPHPHIGLQTVTWLLEGRVLHKDSVGSVQEIRPGQVNWMTAGRGIAHSEETPDGESGTLHGVQLWVALPDAHRHMAPAFAHHPALPRLALDGTDATVIAGTVAGLRSPAHALSPLVAIDLPLPHDRPVRLPLDPAFEHAVLPVRGAPTVAGETVEPGTLLYLGTGRDHVTLHGPDAHVVIVGGAPFDTPVLLWWNFVARTEAEIREATDAWNAGTLTPPVSAYAGEPLPAPPVG